MERNRRPRVSLCMIVRNEEANLADCLAPVRDLFDERIVVDTGSTDGTVALARSFGAEVYEFPWRDDFAAARNESLRRATGDWIFWLDADDRLDAENVARLERLLASLDDSLRAYVMNCRCVAEFASDSATIISQVRLFRRHPDVAWRGRVHEQILPQLQAAGHETVWSDVEIRHDGYRQSAATHQKARRDLRLSRIEFAVAPHDRSVNFHLATAHLRLGEHQAALPYLLRCAEQIASGDDWGRKVFCSLAEIHSRLGDFSQALSANRKGLAIFPNDLELMFQQAEFLARNDQLGAAEACLLRLLATPPQNYMLSMAREHLRDRDARWLLGLVYQDQGRLDDAWKMFDALTRSFPAFVHGWIGLGLLGLQSRSMFAMEPVFASLRTCQDGDIYADLLEAKYCLRQNALGDARQKIERAISRAPQFLWARLVLCELLQAAGDGAGLAAAARDVLRLEPGNPFAANLLRQVGAPLEITVAASVSEPSAVR